jgi:NADH:ubiquinone oxidoreductase subunit 5 (subunit L)/multisubunit Na+/H+ antiporter MnhA subunit
MLNALWLIPIAPFIGFLLNGLFGKRATRVRHGRGLAGSLAAAVLGTVAVFSTARCTTTASGT